MAQISRPYQIALAALGVLALAWFAVLHRPGSSPSASAPAPVAHVSAANSNSASPGAGTSTYHGSAPGVEGLTRAIAKAHGAVKTSENNAAQLQRNSAQASNEAAPSTTSTPSTQHAASAPTHVVVHKTVVHRPAPGHPGASATAAAQVAAQQAVLKHELGQGKTVLLLFWNPKSTDDKSVHQAVMSVSSHLKGTVSVHVALASQVGRYGSLTRNVQVLQTPTLLVVSKKGLALTMAGLIDQYAIEQGIKEAKQASTHQG
ncbi:MAG TPA: hypothetical protein VIC06_03615 [Solirubrobacteraceae bacterium]|jgi:hypothetical protein